MSSVLFGHKKLYINGQLSAATNNKTFEVICPGTEQPIATISWATKEDTLRTLNAAEEGFKHWSELPVKERVLWMQKLRAKIIEKSDDIQKAVVYEMGKTWDNANEDITSITNSLEYYAEEGSGGNTFTYPCKTTFRSLCCLFSV